jgi:8-oxo-dGTP diphosphatase
VVLPYKIATLLYCFNQSDQLLLMERLHEPNLGLWSPCGGKLITERGESPYECACREAEEEIGLKIGAGDLHLTGLISEEGYQGQAHWLMFLFEVKKKLLGVPPDHREGRFQFFSKEELLKLKMPATDVEMIWPLFWKYRGGFFAAHCKSKEVGKSNWSFEEGWMPRERGV